MNILRRIVNRIKNKFLERKYRKISAGSGKLSSQGCFALQAKSGANLLLNGNLRFGSNLIENSRIESTLRMDANAKIIVNGDFQFMYGADVILFKDSELTLGKNSFINSNCKLRCHKSITIGDECAISHDFTIMDSDAHYLNGDNHTSPVVIGNHVWIGTRVTVLSGVHIGDNTVITAGAVVTQDIPAGCLAGGVPARVIRDNVEWSK